MNVTANDRPLGQAGRVARVEQRVDDLADVVARLDNKINALLGIVISGLVVEILRLAIGK